MTATALLNAPARPPASPRPGGPPNAAPHGAPGASRLAAAAAPASAAGGMELRKFVAPTMAECWARVKGELGGGAVILSTRTVQNRRFFGLIRREHVEITAGRGIRTMPRRRPAPGGIHATAEATQKARQILQAVASENSAAARGALGGGGDVLGSAGGATVAYRGMQDEFKDLKGAVRRLAEQIGRSQCPDIPAPLFPAYKCLRDEQVCDDIARQVIQAVHTKARAPALEDPAAVRSLVLAELASRLPTAGPITRGAKGRPRIVALVGPTGVGKTTTIAKLAANLKLRESRKVGLITIDTYRIAAIDQLKKYAEIINAPLSVVSQPAEIRDAIARMGDFDFVLVDTAGRSPRDAIKLQELGAFLKAAAPDEVHLVLSTTCGTESTRLALQRFSGVRADRLIFTKLDEAAAIGVVLNTVSRTRLPLSYVTHGQDVPNDIGVACPRRLAAMALPTRTEEADAPVVVT